MLAGTAAVLQPARVHAGAPLPAASTPAAPVPFLWPQITLLDGSVLGPQEWGDMAAVVVFFATWCPFCARHNPHVQQLHEAVAGKRLRVLGAALDQDVSLVRSYVRRHGYTFAITPHGADLRLKMSARPGLPLTVPFDRSGRMQTPIPGEMFLEDVLELALWADRPNRGARA